MLFMAFMCTVFSYVCFSQKLSDDSPKNENSHNCYINSAIRLPALKPEDHLLKRFTKQSQT